jgi:hypothetical protein
MALYFATMDIEPDAYPRLPVDRLAMIVREVLEGPPLSGVAATNVRRMRALGEMHDFDEL